MKTTNHSSISKLNIADQSESSTDNPKDTSKLTALPNKSDPDSPTIRSKGRIKALTVSSKEYRPSSSREKTVTSEPSSPKLARHLTSAGSPIKSDATSPRRLHLSKDYDRLVSTVSQDDLYGKKISRRAESMLSRPVMSTDNVKIPNCEQTQSSDTSLSGSRVSQSIGNPSYSSKDSVKSNRSIRSEAGNSIELANPPAFKNRISNKGDSLYRHVSESSHRMKSTTNGNSPPTVRSLTSAKKNESINTNVLSTAVQMSENIRASESNLIPTDISPTGLSPIDEKPNVGLQRAPSRSNIGLQRAPSNGNVGLQRVPSSSNIKSQIPAFFDKSSINDEAFQALADNSLLQIFHDTKKGFNGLRSRSTSKTSLNSANGEYYLMKKAANRRKWRFAFVALIFGLRLSKEYHNIYTRLNQVRNMPSKDYNSLTAVIRNYRHKKDNAFTKKVYSCHSDV